MILEGDDMNFLICGKKDGPVLLLIHGMAADAESCYGGIAKELGKRYRVIMACLDGHDPYAPGSCFHSISTSCERIESYILKKHGGAVYAISGFSLGGTIALELVKRGRITTQRLHLDAAFCIDLGVMKAPYTLLFTKGIALMQSGIKLPDILIEFVFGKGNSRAAEMLYPDIDSHSIENACRDVYNYKLSPRLKRYTAPVEFWCGSNEPYPQKSARALESFFPDMRVRVFKGLGHGQMLHEHKSAYIRELEGFLGGRAARSSR